MLFCHLSGDSCKVKDFQDLMSQTSKLIAFLCGQQVQSVHTLDIIAMTISDDKCALYIHELKNIRKRIDKPYVSSTALLDRKLFHLLNVTNWSDEFDVMNVVLLLTLCGPNLPSKERGFSTNNNSLKF